MGFRRNLSLSAFIGGALLAPGSLHATAIASVERNFFTIAPQYGRTVDDIAIGSLDDPIDGILVSVISQTPTLTKTVIGNAEVGFTGDAGPSGAMISGIATAHPNGYAYGLYTLEVTYSFTNLSGYDLAGLGFGMEVSSFNPGGPVLGASVTNSEFEFAAFHSSQTGFPSDGQFGGLLGDQHGCDTRGPDKGPVGWAYFFSGPPAVTCGVMGPDSSLIDLSFSNFEQYETHTATFVLSLMLEVSSKVPEPASSTLLGSAIILLLGSRLRRKTI